MACMKFALSHRFQSTAYGMYEICLISQISVHSLWHVWNCHLHYIPWYESVVKETVEQIRRVFEDNFPHFFINMLFLWRNKQNEPRHDKTNKMSVLPAKTRISLGICPVWSEWSAWASAQSDQSDQPGHLPSLIRVISLGICPVWSKSSLCTQSVAKDPSFLHADSEYFDQTGRMPRLIWVFAGCTLSFCWFCHVAAQIIPELSTKNTTYLFHWKKDNRITLL